MEEDEEEEERECEHQRQLHILVKSKSDQIGLKLLTSSETNENRIHHGGTTITVVWYVGWIPTFLSVSATMSERQYRLQ
jgi:hypothetical protein